MTLSGFVLFGLVLAYLFSDLLIRGLVAGLRALSLLPPPVVRFDGLLDELHAFWPLEDDEQGSAAEPGRGTSRARAISAGRLKPRTSPQAE